jgi:hypothetical protein
VTVTSGIEKNAFKPWWTFAEVTVYGAAAAPKEVRIGDQLAQQWRFDSQAHVVVLTLPDAAKDWTVRFLF